MVSKRAKVASQDSPPGEKTSRTKDPGLPPASPLFPPPSPLTEDTPLSALCPTNGTVAPPAPAAVTVAAKATSNSNHRPSRGFGRIEPVAAAGPGQERPRIGAALTAQEAIVGYQGDAGSDPAPIRFAARGGDLQPGEVFEMQSGEITKEHPNAPIAKRNRAKFNWVARTEGGRFTRDPDKMTPFVKGEKQVGMWTCDVCGKKCCEQLYMFRAYLRKEFIKESGPRRLDPFTAYISWRCGRGLLGHLTETVRFKEEVFSFTSSDMSVDQVRSELEEAMQRGGREDRLNLIEELERLAGIGPGCARKTLEMTAVEKLMPAGSVLLHTAEDAFRAVARTLAPRVSARLLAVATLVQARASGVRVPDGGYLAAAARSLSSGGPLPQAPPKWPLEEVTLCLRLLAEAVNRPNEDPLLRLEIACSWDTGGPRVFGDSAASVVIRLGYLQVRQALHAFAALRVSKELASAVCARLEEVESSADLFPAPRPALSGSGPDTKLSLRRIDRAQALGFGWHSANWAEQLKRLLGASFDFTRRPLRLVTGCSGAEAPHFALQQLVGENGFQQLWAAEINENPRRFILRNCKTAHLFEDICFIMQGGGRCARHGGRCSVPQGEVDIFVAGFPCTPYSFCNPKRFKRNCFTEPAAKPFFEVRRFIADRRPRLVVLENVRGLLAPNPETDCTPMDFILRGRNPENPADCYEGSEPLAEWGLEYISGYGLRWDMVYSSDWGLPQSRPRIYIVMVREDSGGRKAADRIFEILGACSGRLPRGAVTDFLFPPSHERVRKAQEHWEERASKKNGRPACSRFTEALFKTKREELGLGPNDRPYSSQRPAGWYPHATDKMVGQLDIVYTIAERQGLDFGFLIADLSQQVSRGAWRDDGNVPTLTTQCALYSFAHHRTFLGEECLWLNGFPIDRINVDAHTEVERIFLAGNAMSVPVVGAVLFAALVAVDWGADRSSKCASDELPAPVAKRADAQQLLAGLTDGPVMMRCTAGLLDDDDEGALEAAVDEAKANDRFKEVAKTVPEEDRVEEARPWAQRATVLVALARELASQADGRKLPVKAEAKAGAKPEAGKVAPAPGGLLSALQATRGPDPEPEEVEESGFGDGTSWQTRLERVESSDADAETVSRWLQEVTRLLAGMAREERTSDAATLVRFAAVALSSVKDLPLARLDALGVFMPASFLWRELRMPEARGIFGKLLASHLGKEAAPGQDELQSHLFEETWIEQAAQLTGADLAPLRVQLLADLRNNRPLLVRIIGRLLTVWRKDWGVVDDELKAIQTTLTVVLEAWKDSSIDAWCGLRGVLEIGDIAAELSKACELRNKPVSAKALRALSRQLLEEAIPSRIAVLLQQYHLSQAHALIQECKMEPRVQLGELIGLMDALPATQSKTGLHSQSAEVLRDVTWRLPQALAAIRRLGPRQPKLIEALEMIVRNLPTEEQYMKNAPPQGVESARSQRISVIEQQVKGLIAQPVPDPVTGLHVWALGLNQLCKELMTIIQTEGEPDKGRCEAIVSSAAASLRTRQDVGARVANAETALRARGWTQHLDTKVPDFRVHAARQISRLHEFFQERGFTEHDARNAAKVAIDGWQQEPQIPAGWKEAPSKGGLPFFYRGEKTSWSFPAPEPEVQAPSVRQVAAPLTPPQAGSPPRFAASDQQATLPNGNRAPMTPPQAMVRHEASPASGPIKAWRTAVPDRPAGLPAAKRPRHAGAPAASPGAAPGGSLPGRQQQAQPPPPAQKARLPGSSGPGAGAGASSAAPRTPPKASAPSAPHHLERAAPMTPEQRTPHVPQTVLPPHHLMPPHHVLPLQHMASPLQAMVAAAVAQAHAAQVGVPMAQVAQAQAHQRQGFLTPPPPPPPPPSPWPQGP